MTRKSLKPITLQRKDFERRAIPLKAECLFPPRMFCLETDSNNKKQKVSVIELIHIGVLSESLRQQVRIEINAYENKKRINYKGWIKK